VLNNNHSEDGIRYPSIDQLTEITHSKYRLVVATAKRARYLKNHPDEVLVDNPHSKRAIGMALEEIANGKVAVVEAKDVDQDELTREAILKALKER